MVKGIGLKMTARFSLLCVVVLTTVTSEVTGQISSNNAVQVTEVTNRIRKSGSLLETGVRVLSECIHKCNSTIDCRAFFYEPDRRICQLENVIFTYPYAPELLYFYKSRHYKMKQVTPFFECPPSPMGSTYNTAIYGDNTDFTYRIVMSAEPWSTAAANCSQDGGAGLARVLTLDKLQTLQTIFTSCPGYTNIGDYWIDGSNVNAVDMTNITQWSTSDGQPLPPTTEFWTTLDISWPTFLNCLVMPMMDGYQWRNANCNSTMYYVCEKY